MKYIRHKNAKARDSCIAYVSIWKQNSTHNLPHSDTLFIKL